MIMKKLRGLFKFEWTWRCFIVSQIFVLGFLVVTVASHDVLASLIYIFCPIFAWKSVDWIASSANDDKQQPNEERGMSEPNTCSCGCDERTEGGQFRPGHDQKLRTAIEKEAGGILALKAIVEKALGKTIRAV